MILDGGDCKIGLESTIVNCVDAVPRLLRPGSHHAEPAARGGAGGEGRSGRGCAPGTRQRRQALRAVHAAQHRHQRARSRKSSAQLTEDGERVAVLAMRPPRTANKYMTWINAGRRADAYGRELYVNLRTLDKSGAQRNPGRGGPGGRSLGCRTRPAASGRLGGERRLRRSGHRGAARRTRRRDRTAMTGRGTRPCGRECRPDPQAHPRDDQAARLARRHGSPLLIDRLRASIRSPVPRLQDALPGVDLHYALKPLPHPAVVAALRDLGALLRPGDDRRDPAGQARRACLPSAASTRTRSSATRTSAPRCASASTAFVVDNPDEVRKFARAPHAGPNCCCACRSAIRGGRRPVAQVRLRAGRRAADARAWPQGLGITVRGLSFHVGSQVADPAKYVEAIDACARDLIERASATGSRPRHARHRRRIPHRVRRRGAGDRPVLPPDPAGS